MWKHLNSIGPKTRQVNLAILRASAYIAEIDIDHYNGMTHLSSSCLVGSIITELHETSWIIDSILVNTTYYPAMQAWANVRLVAWNQLSWSASSFSSPLSCRCCDKIALNHSMNMKPDDMKHVGQNIESISRFIDFGATTITYTSVPFLLLLL